MQEDIQIPFNKKFNAYITAPDTIEKIPAIIIIHEVWGLNDHIKDVADRFAKQGYLALAPDLLSETGITEKIDQNIMQEIQNPATRDEAQKKMRAAMAPIMAPEFGEKTVEKLRACVDYLMQHEMNNGRVGAVGFCFGGTYAFALAAADKRLTAAVPFYGHAPEPLSKVADIHCPVYAFYGEQDKQLVSSLPDVEEAMIKADINFHFQIYQDTGHAFFNDTNPGRYNAAAAKDAWTKTLDFLGNTLK